MPHVDSDLLMLAEWTDQCLCNMGKYVARWTDSGADSSQGESEGCSVMEQIPLRHAYRVRRVLI